MSFSRKLTSHAIAVAVLVLPLAGHAQYLATLKFSNDFLGQAALDISSNSPDVTLSKQGNQVTAISFALGQVSSTGIPAATPLDGSESFTATVGSEALTFTFYGVFTNWNQPGQTGVIFHVDGSNVPYYDVSNNTLALIAPQTDTSGISAADLHLQFVPFFSDPAFSLLNAINQANGLPAASTTDRAALYNLNVGSIAVSAVPEPNTMALAAIGLLGIGLLSRRAVQQRA